MGKVHEAIPDDLREFIEAQPVFFVATAPLDAGGHVNASPKGLDTFRVLSPTRVMYLDLTGSGNETAAHVTENGRITFMFCAFAGSPRIVRLYGRARAVLPGDAEWGDLTAGLPELPGARQVIVADLHRVQTSCGFGVPRMGEPEARDTLVRWAEAKGEDGLVSYRAAKNARSLDGLPARVMAVALLAVAFSVLPGRPLAAQDPNPVPRDTTPSPMAPMAERHPCYEIDPGDEVAWHQIDSLRSGVGAIEGGVFSRAGEPLPGVQISIDSLRIGALSHADGRLVLDSIPAGTHTLQLVYLGYGRQTHEVSVVTDLIRGFCFILRPVAVRLEEVTTGGERGSGGG